MKSETRIAIQEKRRLIRQGAQRPKMGEQTKMTAFDAVTWQAALILEGKRGVITRSQTKLDKAQGADTGYVNRGLTLSSADEARPFVGGNWTACLRATKACRFACVGSQTGQGALPSSKIARIGRTLAMLADLQRFNALLDYEIESERLRASVFGYLLAFRFNVASDHWEMARKTAIRNPMVNFYDYSAIVEAVTMARDVRRVYSRKNGIKSDLTARAMVRDGYGVSVVFDVKKGEPLPKTWEGAPVIDGDKHDLWFLQAPKEGPFVVGLRVKGSNKQKKAATVSGFAVKVG